MSEKLLGKETESPLGDFCKAAKEYGAKGIEFELHPDGTEVLKQKLGEGWHGLGYDGKNLWLCLTPAGERYDWNANTVLEQPEEAYYKGVTRGEHGALNANHPITCLFSALRGREGVEVHITGAHENWELNERTRLTLDKDGTLVGNIPTGVEIKAVITNLGARWNDGEWQTGETQKLEIGPASHRAVEAEPPGISPVEVARKKYGEIILTALERGPLFYKELMGSAGVALRTPEEGSFVDALRDLLKEEKVRAIRPVKVREWIYFSPEHTSY